VIFYYEIAIFLLYFLIQRLTEVLNGISSVGSAAENYKHVPHQLDQAAPVQNTWYTVCDVVNAYFGSLSVYVMTVNETLEARITIDGVTWGNNTIAAVNGTVYYVRMSRLGNVTNLVYDATGDHSIDNKVGTYGLSIKIEVRKTTATGAGNLRACAIMGENQ
jgi:hypothetical protein